ncbi:hypothetical protein TRIUR3_03553 [Triticum urartu]|uniref:Wall-associated receptor kinase C-terminal domain-containing protein n=1 Tax=Triticum urartu TaxID=4572 RepID=M7Z482_TRIUA|nr:hypothetical protein TRIUR3_03553 [Triticum urartu]
MPPAVLILPLLLSSFLLLVRVAVDAECEPAACGNLTIRYPFWLGAPTRPTPEPSCGHPALQLCNATAAFGCLCPGEGELRGSTCAGNLALSPFKISPSNHALCFLFNCNGTEPRGREYANATAGCSRPIVAYLGGSFVRDTPPAIPTRTCTYAYLPVLGAEAAVSTAANYSRLLKAGFLLDWAGAGIGIGDCPACVASGGQCRYRSATAALACLCPGGKLRGPTCADSRLKNTFLEIHNL